MKHIRMLCLSAVFLLPLFAGGARADTLFATTAANAQVSAFGTLNTATGVYTPIGSNSTTLAGIGTQNGVLYGALWNSTGTLYSINTATGVLTTIGTQAGVSYLDFAVANGGLYAVSTTNNLYSINATTGAASLIGPTGLSASTQNHNSLASGTTGLFYDLQDAFYSLSPMTGAATFIGCGGNLAFGQCSGPQMDAMADSNGTLYGAENVVSHLYSVNTSTGAMTDLLVLLTGQQSAFTGLSVAPSSVSAVPLPATLPLFASGLAGLGLLGWRRKKAAAG
jgi:hypothetical protein